MTKRKTREDFVKEATLKHKGFYTYDNTIYVNSSTPLLITCPIHGDFKQTPANHLYGKGCPQCASKKRGEEQSFRNGKFEEIASKIHQNRYAYPNIKNEYKNAHSKIHFQCNKCGKITEMTALLHLRGTGCECYKPISKLEQEIKELLEENNLDFISQYRFDDWKVAPYDFFLPDANLIIECQGKQHFGEGGWSDNYDFNEQRNVDQRKYNFCLEKGVNIIYYTHQKKIKDYFGEIYFNKNDILEKIKLFMINNKSLELK